MYLLRKLVLALIVLRVACEATAAGLPAVPRWPALAPAQAVGNAAGVPLLSAAWAGRRVVAVGDHGAILLSDDGVHYRQAKTVPVRSLLTVVQFVDARQGYAAGHDGVVLGTSDGGETWKLLRAEPGVEQPILSLHFDSAVHGIAVGLFGWAIETADGGQSWHALHVGSGEDGDRHLLHMFATSRGTLLIAGEAGSVFRSADGGKTWQALATGGQGSLWSGMALADGSLLVCGMRGHLYRSVDDGLSWQAVISPTTQSLTGIAQLHDGSVAVVGMAGTVLRSTDNGKTFTLAQREEREPLTAVLAGGSGPVLLSMVGPLHAQTGATGGSR